MTNLFDVIGTTCLHPDHGWGEIVHLIEGSGGQLVFIEVWYRSDNRVIRRWHELGEVVHAL